MIGLIRHHGHSLARCLARVWAAPFASAFNFAAIGLAMSLPLLAYVVLQNVASLVPRLDSRPQVTVFLAPGTSRDQEAEVERSLRSDAAVSDVRFVSRDEALAGLKRSPGVADVVGVLRENPLPDAFIVSLRDGDPDAAERIATSARSTAHVAHAQSDSLWARRLQSIIDFGRNAVAMLSIFFAVVVVAVTFNTIRLQILTERDEIEVSALVGATDSFIRRPFLYWGCLTGALGALAALGFADFALLWMNQDMARLAELYSIPRGLQFLTPGEASAVVVGAGALGWLGAMMAVSIHLREKRF